MKILGAVFFLIWSQTVEARVFNLTKERFGSYLMFSGAQSNLKDTVFAGESSATEFTEEYKFPVGGEFGFMYSTPKLGMRFGFEIIKPMALEGDAKAGGSKLYHYNNDVTVLSPKIGLEINFKTGNSYRISAFGFYGSAILQSKTDYTQVAIGPMTDHSVEMKGSSSMYGGGLAAEVAAFDTTTFMLEVGYRQLKFGSLTYGKDVTTFNGTYSAGDPVKNSDEEDRLVDFTGAYVSAGFRFYLF